MARIRILWTSQAKDDLREIRKFIARDAPRIDWEISRNPVVWFRRFRDPRSARS
jgi:plasmid stabilization system protein ParE